MIDSRLTAGQIAEVIELHRVDPMRAIRRYRDLCMCSVKEAKDGVEAIMRANGGVR